MNILVRMAYDGTNYCGFQVQPNGTSVAAVFQDALESVLGCRPDIKGCSRTDAGVHARDFALNFRADTAIPMEKLPLALNARLPADIRVFRAQQVSEDFHARYSAHEKTYEYRIRNSAVESPFDSRYTVRIPRPLDAAAMAEAAAYCVGTHDFTAFCAAGSAAAAHGDTVRTVSACTAEREGELIFVRVTADGYLYHMVRILAGTLAEAGAHRIAPAAVADILASRDRGRAGPTLPAKGLALLAVRYGE